MDRGPLTGAPHERDHRQPAARRHVQQVLAVAVDPGRLVLGREPAVLARAARRAGPRSPAGRRSALRHRARSRRRRCVIHVTRVPEPPAAVTGAARPPVVRMSLSREQCGGAAVGRRVVEATGRVDRLVRRGGPVDDGLRRVLRVDADGHLGARCGEPGGVERDHGVGSRSRAAPPSSRKRDIEVVGHAERARAAAQAGDRRACAASTSSGAAPLPTRPPCRPRPRPAPCGGASASARC